QRSTACRITTRDWVDTFVRNVEKNTNGCSHWSDTNGKNAEKIRSTVVIYAVQKLDISNDDGSYRLQNYHRRYHGKYTCDACGKEYTWKPSLTRHKREDCDVISVHGRQRYICDACGKWYKHSLMAHKRKECGKEQQYAIKDSDSSYVFLFYFSVPKLIVKNIQKLKYAKKPVIYKCTRCTKSYQLETSLRRHQRLECGVHPKYKCIICGKQFTHKFVLTHHLAGIRKKSIGDAKYECGRCGKTYKATTSLSRHKRLECGVVPCEVCPICGRRFKHRFVLNAHIVGCERRMNQTVQKKDFD
ncbi:hypothetical protein ALC60_10286, partial [Trachymyrmex zeteki]